MNGSNELKRDRRWIDLAGIGAGLVLTVVAVWLCLTPILAQRDAVAERLVHLNEQHTRAEQGQRTLASQGLSVEELRLRHKSEAIELQPADRINRHVSKLTRLINKRGLEVHQIQPGQTARNDRYCIVPIVIAGQGEYPDCAAFFNELQAAFPDTGVTHWELLNTLNNLTQPPSYRLELAWHTRP
jgi:Tfp pilus assembly protein PilO